MIIIFTRKQIADGAFFSKITDKRFKTNQISVFIMSEFDSAPRADYAVAAYILSDCCKKFANYRTLSKQLSNLYDASLSSNTSFVRVCDQRLTYIGGVILDDRYALEGEKLETEYSELLRECLLRPNAENGEFDETVTSLMRGELIDTIDSVINEKSSYAAQNAARTAFVGEPGADPAYGTHEEADKVTARSAYAAYRKILETGHFEIVAAGYSDFDDAERIFTEMMSEIERHDICELTCEPSPLKAEPAYASDKLPMQQAILRMYFKAPELTDYYANKLFTMILGGMTTSRFFMNIREKQSLCYYCACVSNKFKRTLTAYAGIEPQNIERAQKAIAAEIESICENGITDEELKAALLEIENQVASMRDTTAVAGWYLDQIRDEKILSPEEYLAEIKKVTPERIKAVARLYKLDTVYTLSGEDMQ